MAAETTSRTSRKAGGEPAFESVSPLVVETRPEPRVSVLTLDGPRARNSLSRAMLAALRAAVARLSEDPEVAAVVLAAEGHVFSAGHDLKELTAHRADPDGGRAFYAETMQACAEVMQAIVASPKPFIAAVEGVATAAGCQLVATCDLAVASSAAAFATPGVNIGLFCSTPMVALSRVMGRKHAMEMLLLGEMIAAAKAADYGLVNRVVDPGCALDEALSMARVVASKSGATVAVGKQAFYRQVERPLAEAYDLAVAVMVENMLARDAEEGIAAFLDKRPPLWKDH